MPPKAINKNADAPTFTLQNGTVLELRRIPSLISNRFTSDWLKRHPAPLVPMVTLTNGDPYPDYDNAGYQDAKAIHDGSFVMARVDFVIQQGIVTSPPKDYVNAYGLEGNPKILWITEQLADDDEYSELVEAITSLGEPTKEAIEDAEKN